MSTISVCIATMRRFSFLKESIPRYLSNPHVSEIIIVDETGEDYEAITNQFSDTKLKVYKNESRLGILKNKLMSASYATSDFISIMDSDNFADEKYFEAFKKFVDSTKSYEKCLFLPCASVPYFNYEQWCDIPITKENINQMFPDIDVCLNTMNLIVSRKFLNAFDILNDVPICNEVGCYDAKYFALYAMFHMNGTLHVVPQMEYQHRVHDGSSWLLTHHEVETVNQKLNDKYLSSNYVKYNLTLEDWQNTCKRPRELIVQASSTNEDDAWMPFPIGMNFRYPGIFRYGNHSNIVLCAINVNTDQNRRQNVQNRKQIIETLAENGIHNKMIDSGEYFDTLSSYKFVVSPEGNGIDCHRHYEALIDGCIPIMERNELTEKKYKGCPVLWTTNYKEITPEYLLAKYDEMKKQTYDFSSLFLDFYPLDVQEEIKRCSTYWMLRFNKNQFYLNTDPSYKNMSKLEKYFHETVKQNDLQTGGWSQFYYGVISDVINENNFTRVAEVGIGYGTHAKQILKTTNVEQLYLVDPMVFYENDQFANNIMSFEAERPGDNFNELANLIRNELSQWKNRFTWYRQPSLTINNEQIADNFLDCVFIDGDHSYDAVFADLKFWWNKLRKNGQLLGDDYWMPQVSQAVHDFAQIMNLDFDFLYKLNTDYKIYRFYKKS